MQKKKPWMKGLPWDAVQDLNQSLCERQSLDAKPGKEVESARRIWEKAWAQSMSLPETLDVCKECNELFPFVFNNGNTFAAACYSMVEDWAQTLPPLEAQMLRTAVGHYVNGLIGKKELLDTLRHVETSWRIVERPAAKSESTVLPPAPQRQPA